MRDPGPIYTETDASRFPVEPWSVASNLVFLALILYWGRKTRLRLGRHPLIGVGLPILVVGCVGGTVYHATRSHVLWLAMDWMPIAALALMGAGYFWYRVTGSLLAAGIAPLVVFLTAPLFVFRSGLPRSTAISIGYSLHAVNVVLPAALHCALKTRRRWALLAGALASFAVAVTLRFIDRGLGARLLPMGTHWLWHVFGGVSAWLVMAYTYATDLDRMEERV